MAHIYTFIWFLGIVKSCSVNQRWRSGRGVGGDRYAATDYRGHSLIQPFVAVNTEIVSYFISLSLSLYFYLVRFRVRQAVGLSFGFWFCIHCGYDLKWHNHFLYRYAIESNSMTIDMFCRIGFSISIYTWQ